MADIAGEVARLRTEIELLTQGLVLQQQSLMLMDEKLDRLLEAATMEPESDADPLADALRRIIGLLSDLSDGQREILDRLSAAQAH
jgi:hypothetical protein